MSLRNNFSPILNIISNTSDVAVISTQSKTFYLEQPLNLAFLTKSKTQVYLQEWIQKQLYLLLEQLMIIIRKKNNFSVEMW